MKSIKFIQKPSLLFFFLTLGLYNFSFAQSVEIFQEGGLSGLKKDGKVILKPTYTLIDDFKDGFAQVANSEQTSHGYVTKFGVIDKTGKLIIPVKYDAISSFHGNVASVSIKGKSGLVDKTGKELTPQKYDDIMSYPYDEGFYRVRIGDKKGLVNYEGKEFIPVKYDEIKDFDEGLIRVSIDGKWGYLDKNGNEFLPLKYQDLKNFAHGLAGAKLNGKWGFIDRQGKEAIPFQYEEAGYFLEEYGEVKKGGKWGYINKNNEVVLPFIHSTSIGLAVEHAFYMTGLFYFQGFGDMEQSFEESFNYFKKAAEMEHPEGTYMFGYMYYSGTGVKQDQNEGYKWILKAAELGSEDAKKVLNMN